MLRACELFKLKQLERYITHNVKNRSQFILRLWGEHCEYILAQRFRRSHQLLSFYRQLWDQQSLIQLLQRFKRQVKLFQTIFFFADLQCDTFDYCTSLSKNVM